MHRPICPQTSRIDFDRCGPRIGSVALLEKTVLGFRPRADQALAELRWDHAYLDPIRTSLERIADAMNKGDLTLAGLATAQLSQRLGSLLEAQDGLSKAGVDDPEHPGFPAKTPDGKGGQFRPKDASEVASVERAEKAKRLALRRSARLALRRVLSFKRILRLVGENAAGVLTEAVPGLDVVVTAAALADDMATLEELAEAVSDARAAADFAEKGPVELQSLQRGESDSFSSFDAFKKSDLEKRFGPAADGCDYHHIVEQGPNAGIFSASDLQSTDNIVEIPRLLHEDITAYYATPQRFAEGLMTPRSLLRGQSFEAQWNFGVDVLQKFGAVK